MKPNSVRFALALVLAAGLLIAVANRHAVDAAALQQGLEQAGAWAPLAFVALYAAATVLFLPGSVLTLAAGALFGPLLGALYSLLGATGGAALAFLIARYLAGGWASRKAGGRLKQLMDGVEAEGWRFVAFVRLVPLFPFNLVNYAFGLTRVRLATYILTSFVAMAPGALAYAWLGHAGREAFSGSEGAVRNALLALALLAVVAFLPRLVRHFRTARMIDPEILRALLAEGGIQVVDVREPADFAAAHIPGACNIPIGQLAERADELASFRESGVVLVCRTHVRSGQAARLLSQRGFTGIRVVNGGMQSWAALDYPTKSFEAPATDARARA